MKRVVALTPFLLAYGCSLSAKALADSACRDQVFDGATFTDCMAEPGKHAVTLVLDGQNGRPLRGLVQLKRTRNPTDRSIVFAMNAGMFDESGKPVGLYVEAGKERKPLNRQQGSGNFHLLPNGVFSVEPDGWHVRTSDAYAARKGQRAAYATQSGPMLLIGGKLHPRISENGSSLHVRNAVGIDRQGRAHFVISRGEVSFGQLARFFRDALNCADALYLDGFVSSLWNPAGDRLDNGAALGPLILVEDWRP